MEDTAGADVYRAPGHRAPDPRRIVEDGIARRRLSEAVIAVREGRSGARIRVA